MTMAMAVAACRASRLLRLGAGARPFHAAPAPPPRPGHSGAGRSEPPPWQLAAAAAAVGALLASPTIARQFGEHPTSPGSHPAHLPVYTLAEVARHRDAASGVWVAYRGGVYDVTEFVNAHPGGEHRIMKAAGGRLEPYWNMYAQHSQASVQEVLAAYRIGVLPPDEAAAGETGTAADPYAKGQPEDRDPRLVTRSKAPFVGETPEGSVAASMVTPTPLFFVRNHFPVPEVDAETYRLRVGREGGPPSEFSLRDLGGARFKQHEVTTTVMCAGNRRGGLTEVRPVAGLKWGEGAVGTATWRGPLLRDVLAAAGVEEAAAADEGLVHVLLTGLDAPKVGDWVDEEARYEASIPARKAFDARGECILAVEMNGHPIPRDHGYPVRAIVPGHVGARNVKWLGSVTASSSESRCHFMQKDYKGFNSSTEAEDADFSALPPIQELPINSAITWAGVEGGAVLATGYAYSGGGRGISRVDVSVDGGKTWVDAELKPYPGQEDMSGRWAWTLWAARASLPAGGGTAKEVICKAADASYNVQPESPGPLWNIRGVLNNSWHRVSLEGAGKPGKP